MPQISILEMERRDGVLGLELPTLQPNLLFLPLCKPLLLLDSLHVIIEFEPKHIFHLQAIDLAVHLCFLASLTQQLQRYVDLVFDSVQVVLGDFLHRFDLGLDLLSVGPALLFQLLQLGSVHLAYNDGLLAAQTLFLIEDLHSRVIFVCEQCFYLVVWTHTKFGGIVSFQSFHFLLGLIFPRGFESNFRKIQKIATESVSGFVLALAIPLVAEHLSDFAHVMMSLVLLTMLLLEAIRQKNEAGSLFCHS